MIRRPAGGHTRSAAAGRHFKALPKRNPRLPLPLTIKTRGGPEAWVEIHCRGSIIRYPGYVDIASIVQDLNNCQ